MSAMLLKDNALITTRVLEDLTSGYGRHDFAVRLWDGTTWGDDARPRFTLVLKHPGALRNMFTSPSELMLGEAFIYDDFDIEGNVEAAFALADHLLAREWGIGEQLRVGSLLRKLPDAFARQNTGILHPNWANRRLVYSCGYFKSANDDLDTAQEQKLDYI